MYRRQVFFLIVLSTLLSVQRARAAPSGPDDGPALSVGDILFGVDATSFRGAQGMAHVEVYLQVHTSYLRFTPEEKGYRATITVQASLRDSSGQEVSRSERTKTVPVPSLEQAQSRYNAVLDQMALPAPPGDYTLQVTITNQGTERMGQCARRIHIPPYDGEGLVLSQVQLASDIHRAEKEGAFSKKGFEVVPNVTHIFASTSPTLHFYFEVYNLKEAPEKGSLSLQYTILDANEFPVITYPSKRILKPGTSGVKAESLDMTDLPGGAYTLQVEVQDDLTGQVARSRRQFQLAQPISEQLLATDEASLQRYYDQIKYIATPKELRAYKGLTPEGKVRFILDFWKRKDPDPETPVNEFAQEHFRRIAYSDAHFASMGSRSRTKRGMDTDMGKVYIKYGPPDEVEDQLMPTADTGQSEVGPSAVGGNLGRKPVQIWYYDTMGRYLFIFRDRYGLGVYELVHSTMPGEHYDPEWRERQ